MKKILLALGLMTSFSSQAALNLTNCVISEPAPGSNVTGIFFDIRFNITEEIKALRLPGPESIQGATIDGLSATAEIHETVMVDGIMKMKQLTQYKISKPNTTIKFERGGLHLMVRDFEKRPVAGEEYKLTLWSTYTDEPSCMAKVVKRTNMPMQHKH
ncbi:copper chaperone PCu(A)C [Vibrio splendidus]|uniref:copper chaperone PCu(A)C n=1 Tax=Vibrio splendidus TaxID=29497 RepID=UPI0024698807|nr:copper chaperone PCu(A)C [Vibrio splendidus]MDH5934337.1 copper chaperone PCu(A)C [Vibrio splendidus]